MAWLLVIGLGLALLFTWRHGRDQDRAVSAAKSEIASLTSDNADLIRRIEELSLEREVQSKLIVAGAPQREHTDSSQLSSVEAIEATIIHDVARLKGNWKSAFTIASRWTTLDSKSVTKALRNTWKDIAHPSDRLGILRAFLGHEGILEILDLGMHDRDPTVQHKSAQFLEPYALRSFGSDVESYDAWRAQVQGMPLDDIIRANAEEFVITARNAGPESVRELTDLVLSAVGVSTASVDALRDVGFLEVAERWVMQDPEGTGLLVRSLPEFNVDKIYLEQTFEKWLKSGAPETTNAVLNAMSRTSLEETYLRRVVVPLILDDSGYRAQAIAALGREDNAWSSSIILPYLRDSDRNTVWSTASSLAAMQQHDAIPEMIQAIKEDGTYDTIYGIGFFGLKRLTGVPYNDSHDGAWWENWWTQNQHRFPLNR